MGLRGTSIGVLAAILGVAVSASAANRGVAVRNGDEVDGVIAPASDVDAFLINLPVGGGLTVKVVDDKTGLLPTLSLRAPDGGLVDVSGKVKGLGKPKIALKNFPIDETGIWQVSIGGTLSTTGAYKAKFTVRYPRSIKLKGSIVAGGSVRVFPAAGMDGATLGFSIKEKSGSAITAVRVLDPADDEMAVPAESIVHKGTKWTGKGIVLSHGFGTYGVEARAAPGPNSFVDAVVTVKPPKPEKRTLPLNLEPRPTDMNPEAGRDGAAVNVFGTAFAEGAQVWFGDVQAEDAVVVSSTEIECTAPWSADSDQGNKVEIRVVNPDGQENGVGKTFKFHGIPDPDSVNPFFAPLGGGTTLTITGKNFRVATDPAFSVTIGGMEADDVSVVGPGTITCTAPNLGEAGVVEVAITDEFGRTGSMAAGPRYVGAPTLEDASPTSCSFVGGRIITVTGSGMRAGNRVFVGGEEAETVEYVNPTTLRFAMPAGPAGALDLQIQDEFDQASAVAEGLLHRRGPFVNRTGVAVPAAPEGNDFFSSSIGLGDLDGDGDLDMLVTARYAYYFYDYNTYTGYFLPADFVLMNDGDGNFADESESRRPEFSSSGDYGTADTLVMGDLDGDSTAEVALFSRYPHSYYPWMFYVGTNSSGPVFGFYGYTSYYGYAYIDMPTAPAGRLVANDGSGHLSEDVDGFPWVSTPMTGSGERWQGAGAALGDLDGDGSLDLVVTAPFQVSVGTVSSVAYYANFSYGYGYYNCYVYYQTGGNVSSTRVLTNDGDGNLSPTATMPAVTYFSSGYVKEAFEGNAVALGDLDGDGALDIVVTKSYPTYYYPYGYYYSPPGYFLPATRVLQNDGSGTSFSAAGNAMPQPFGATPAGAGSYEYWQADIVSLGDLDGDGDQDMVLGRHYIYYWTDASYVPHLVPAILVFKNDGAGHFAEATGEFLAPTSYAGHSEDTILGVTAIHIGDLDGDGSVDMVVTSFATGAYDYNGTGYGYNGIIPSGYRSATRVLLNDGLGNFQDETVEWMPEFVNGDYFQGDELRFGDLDGDGDDDLVLGNEYQMNGTDGYNRPLRILRTE